MTALDALLLLLIAAAAVGAYRLGFLARFVSWIFMGVGLLVTVRLLPRVLGLFDGATGRELLLLSLLLLLVGAFVGQGLGLALGSRLRLALPHGRARTADQLGGALAGALVVVLTAWLVLPAMADTPGWPAEQARSSAIAGFLTDRLPPPPDTLQAFRAFVGEDQFPQVFDSLQRTPDLGPPPDATGISAETDAVVTASVVKVEGVACRRQLAGSGFVAAPETVVTNAHVVAGETATTVIRSDGSEVPGRVVTFDPERDLAVLRVPGLDRPPLPIGDGAEGTGGGVYGFPGGGPLRVAPFEIARRIRATGRDIYNEGQATREVFELAAGLAPGDSGAALVDPGGAVVGVAFALAPDRADVGFALTTAELSAVLVGAGDSTVSTGACVA